MNGAVALSSVVLEGGSETAGSLREEDKLLPCRSRQWK